MATGTIKKQISGWKLLWENNSKTSNFGAQTVPVDLTGYSEVLIAFGVSKSEWASQRNMCRVAPINSDIYTFDAAVYYSGTPCAFNREVTFSNSGVTFSTGNFNSSSSAEVMIPHKIYAR